jgi:hypothetical protein
VGRVDRVPGGFVQVPYRSGPGNAAMPDESQVRDQGLRGSRSLIILACGAGWDQPGDRTEFTNAGVIDGQLATWLDGL